MAFWAGSCFAHRSTTSSAKLNLVEDSIFTSLKENREKEREGEGRSTTVLSGARFRLSRLLICGAGKVCGESLFRSRVRVNDSASVRGLQSHDHALPRLIMDSLHNDPCASVLHLIPYFVPRGEDYRVCVRWLRDFRKVEDEDARSAKDTKLVPICWVHDVGFACCERVFASSRAPDRQHSGPLRKRSVLGSHGQDRNQWRTKRPSVSCELVT